MRTLTQPLNMSPGGIPPVIHVSQYDSDFTIVFTLFSTVGDFTIEAGTTAMVRGTKSSGTGYSADAAIDISAKTVTVTGNQQMTAAAGQNVFEITLLKSGKEISSKNFILLCERAALDADTITDESVLKELNAIIEGAETATQAAEEAEDAADRAEAAAQTLVIDSTPTQGSSNAVSSGGVYDEIADLKDDLSESDVLQKLLHDNVPDTVQNYTFTDGTVSKVEHKSGNVIKRSDVFTYGTSSITEVRTLNSGESLTIVTNLSTLETTVTYQGTIPYQKIYSINDAVQGAWVYSNGSYSNNGRTDRAGSKMLGYTPQIGDVIKVEDSLKRYKFTTGTGTNNYRTTSTDDLVVDETAMTTLKTILFVKVDNSDFTNDDLAFLNQNTHVYRRIS